MNEKTSNADLMAGKYQRSHRLLQSIWARNSRFLNTCLFPNWIGDSDCFWYERELKEGKEFRLVNAKSASNNLAFDHAVLAAALTEASGEDVDANNLSITGVKMQLTPATEDETIALIEFTQFEQRWGFDLQTKRCSVVETTDVDWVVSPDKKQAVFKRDYNLWLRDLSSGEEKALTQDGVVDYIYGASGSTWGEEMDPEPQALWSPDAKRLFVVQRDTRQVLTLPTVHHVPQDGGLRPTVEYTKMAYPGDEHVETLRLVAIDCETGQQQAADYPQIPTTRNGFGFFSCRLGWWSADSRRAYFVDMARDYKTVRVVEFDVSTGVTRIVIEQSSQTQIDLMLDADERPTFVPMPDSNELLWLSERDGWAHLYLYDLETGALKNAVTQGDWMVRQIVQVDGSRREAFIQTMGRVSGRDPYYRDLCRVDLDSGELKVVVSGDYDVTAVMQKDHNTALAEIFTHYNVSESNAISPTGEFAVVTQSRADEIPVSLLINRNGELVSELEVADVSALPDNWQWPEPVKLLAADGETELYGLVYRPSDFSAAKRYPVVSHVYNSPDLPWVSKGSFSNALFFGYPYFDAAAIAELGFVVVQIDGRGTPFRNKQFHDQSYGWAESAGSLDDHVAGLQQLGERHSYMDLSRVGIVSPGGGPGGLQGLLQYPDFYKVGVANFLHDSRLMAASMWGDKYEGVSGAGPKYQYPEAKLESLQGKLLLINGMLDTCTPPAGVFRVIEALQKANKDFDMLLLPNLGHAAPVGYVVRRTWDYLVKNLLEVEPPKEFQLSTIFDL